jgi:hypothetical protein
MLVDSLIKQPLSTAAVVDTMGNFDVVGIYTGNFGEVEGR